MNIENRINELIEIINYHAEKYYNQDSPEISDYEYDQLMNELRSLDPKGQTSYRQSKALSFVKDSCLIFLKALMKEY